MIVLLLLFSALVWLALGLSMLRAHPRAGEMMMAAVLRPWPDMLVLAGRVILWPWRLSRPVQRRGTGRP